MLRKILISFLTVASIGLVGCSSLPFADRFKNDEKKKEEATAAIANAPEIPAVSLLNAGIRNVNIRDYKKAQKAFSEIGKQHPFSKEAQRSLVLSAYAHFTEGDYDKTVAKAQRYIQLYPGSTDAAYMQYLVGESYFKRINSVLLDQDDTSKGLRAYTNLVRLYPESKYIEDAKIKIVFMNDQLAGKEMQIGRYYQERRQHLAAVNRFRTVAESYQKTRHIEESLFRLTESYLSLGIVSEAQTAAALLGYNYPDSDWYKNAYTLLTGNNLQPKVNEKSSLTRFIPFVGGDDKPKVQQVALARRPKKENASRGLKRFVPFIGKNRKSARKKSGLPPIGNAAKTLQSGSSSVSIAPVKALRKPGLPPIGNAAKAFSSRTPSVSGRAVKAVQPKLPSIGNAAKAFDSGKSPVAAKTLQKPGLPTIGNAVSLLQPETEKPSSAKKTSRGLKRFIPFTGKKKKGKSG